MRVASIAAVRAQVARPAVAPVVGIGAVARDAGGAGLLLVVGLLLGLILISAGCGPPN